MSENVDNLVLEQLRAMREDMKRMEGKIDTLTQGMDDVGGRVDGLSIILVNFGTNIHDLNERVGHIEQKLGIDT